MMRMVELIEKKKSGYPLTREEIRFIVQGYVQGIIPDYQVSAWAMAVYFKGMTVQETSELTMAMAESGDQLELSLPGKVFVDKHSSGGVGDKTTLVVAPLVAACGVPVAKMSGRGLGHTGGTIDKLSAIPGFRVELGEREFLQQVGRIGLAVIAQTGRMVPADKKLYALRDVTATIDSIPMIASSIMSKKIAAGAHGIVLDVKYGSGAFMATLEEAETLAEIMAGIGKNLGRDMVAVLSSMDQPLGRAVGNGIEVLEAIECLQGNGPDDLMEVCLELASWMLVLGKKAATITEAAEILKDTLQSGRAWEKFLAFIQAQGGDTAVLHAKNLPLASEKIIYKAERAGYIQHIDARKIGLLAMVLGAGRENKDSEIDLGAGVYLLKKAGDAVQAGEPLCMLYTSSAEKSSLGLVKAAEAITIGEERPLLKPTVSTVIR
ncbi:Pyrimidine-nucleoside phosphorylase [Dehalobacter sp. DCA]|nr:Pyrimidine-nucleoside phosphorylase [Dehalobacter sp. DCA]AFV04540.1 Pyrimidine-nucleoside phosphorylase [Dehalobacter sp. CF]